MIKNGIDVSRWQGSINWCKACLEVDFCIIKLGGNDDGLYKDKYFDYNYMGCKAHNIPVGCYFFLGADTNTEKKGYELAIKILDMLKGYKFELPVYIDVEATRPAEKDGVTSAVVSICDTLERAGYYVGVYGSDVSTFRDRLNLDKLARFDKWVARYPITDSCTVVKSCGMRQHSSKGRINGIVGDVDLDIAYYDFPTIIKNKHLNGF